MRPIKKGKPPRDEQNQLVQFNKYQEARGYLYERIGRYCSYCERPLTNGEVEHKLPKKNFEQFREKWNNFLLACKNCNTTKGRKGHDSDGHLTQYFWPDRDNTFLVFVYGEGGMISINEDLSPLMQEKAQRTMELTGLHKRPSFDLERNPEKRDLRWEERRDAWDMAVLERESLKEEVGQPSEEKFRNGVVKLAKATGFWSVWMTVFQDDEDMLRRLIEAYVGTRCECFDHQYQPVHHFGGTR